MNNFKKYYLSTFAAFLVIFFLMFLLNKSPNSFIENMGICIGMAIILSLVVGSGTYYINEVWLPKTRKSILEESPFKELLADGFKEQDGFISKIIHGYTIRVSFERESYKYIMVKALFNAEVNGHSYSPTEIKDIFKPYDTHTWYQNKLLWWGDGIVYYQIIFAFNLPKYQIVQQKIDELIRILQAEALQPF